MSEQGSGQGHPPPGWYPDPERPGNRRWWDGLAWTDFSEPLDGRGSASGGPPPGPSGGPGAHPGTGASSGGPSGGHAGAQGGYGGPQGGYAAPGGYGASQGGYGSGGYGTPYPQGGGYGGMAPKVDPWLWQSIVVTVLCCLPLGIVGIIFASQSQTELGRGNYREAEEKAKQAKTFTIIGFAIGLLGIFIWVPIFLVPW